MGRRQKNAALVLLKIICWWKTRGSGIKRRKKKTTKNNESQIQNHGNSLQQNINPRFSRPQLNKHSMNCEMRKSALIKDFQAIFTSLPASNCISYSGLNTLLKKPVIIMTNIQNTTQEGSRNTPEMHIVLSR